MSRREDQKKKSLGDLARIATKAEEMPWLDKRVQAAKPAAPSAPKPKAEPPPPPKAAAPTTARAKQLEERRLKLEEEKRLKSRRANELARGSSLEWRGMSQGGMPKGVHRTAFDVVEPSLHEKIAGVLGDPKKKESREKMGEKARRQR